MARTYMSFEEVENEIRNMAPLVVYKYRNWNEIFHRKIITDKEVWFAEPHTLNDPYDFRPPYNFIINDVDEDKFRQKIYEAGRAIEPDLSDNELMIEVELRLQDLKEDPIKYFEKNRGSFISNRNNYSQLGVFSCCISGTNEPMWAHYGANHGGFAVGFNTVELARAVNATAGHVIYSDQPLDYRVMGDNRELFEKEIFQKSRRWSAEEEFRFSTAGIGIYKIRTQIYPVIAVSEILFGLNTDKGTQDEIIAIAEATLPGVPFFHVATQINGYGFQKVPL